MSGYFPPFPLARLLQTDVNTLLCFQQTLSEQELKQFTSALSEAVRRGGIQAGFSDAEEKMREYPNCSALRYVSAVLLDAALVLSELPPEEKQPYEEQIVAWYTYVLDGPDGTYTDQAAHLLATKYLQTGAYDAAQALIDRLPYQTPLNRQTLQAALYAKQNRSAEAAELMEQQVLYAANMLYTNLTRLIDYELAAGAHPRAAQIAQAAQKAIQALDLWDFYGYALLLQVAVAEQNAEQSLRQIRALCTASFAPWQWQHSPFYCRIGQAYDGMAEQILPPLLKELETSPDYAFLRPLPEFQALLSEVQIQWRDHVEKSTS